MPNPFDQFDAPAASGGANNVFDKFDAPPEQKSGTAPVKVEPEKIYYNDAGQPFYTSGKPVPLETAPTHGYTGTLLPLRHDASGLHFAVPEAIASPVRGAATGGARALGIADARQDPLRTLTTDEIMAASLGVDQVFATGGKVPLNAVPPASPQQRLLGDFEKAGVTPNVPTVGQGRVAGSLAQVGSYLPATGPVIKRGIEGTMGETASAAERAATGFGEAATPEQAGGALQRGVTNFAKSVFPDRAETLYDKFDQMMVGAEPATLSNTLQSLRGPMTRFPTSPELGAKLTNPQLRGYAETLAPKTTEVPPLFSSILDANGQPILLRAAEKVQTGGALTFDELKELRSTIGRKLADPVLVSDIPRADLKSVYTGITKDLEVAARKQGPEALKAFKNATDFYRAGLARIDRIEGILTGPPERAFAKINSAAQGGDAGLLRSVKKSMAPEEWREVGAAVIRRLGQPTPGAKDILSEANFSPSSYVTNWSKLSDTAKDALFGANVPDSARAGLETLARVTQAQKNLGKLANVSRSAEHGITFTLAARAVQSLISGNFKELAGMAGGAAAGYGLAKLLMSPGFTRWLYRMPELEATSPSLEVTGQRASALLMELMNRNEDNFVEPSQQPTKSKAAMGAMGLQAIPF